MLQYVQLFEADFFRVFVINFLFLFLLVRVRIYNTRFAILKNPAASCYGNALAVAVQSTIDNRQSSIFRKGLLFRCLKPRLKINILSPDRTTIWWCLAPPIVSGIYQYCGKGLDAHGVLYNIVVIDFGP